MKDNSTAQLLPCAAFTPGPWLADLHNEKRDGGRFYVFITGADLAPVAAVTSGVEGYGRDEGRANARLIAAAPELYEALDELAALMRDVVDGNYAPDSFTTQPAELALAKARGEQ